MEVIHLSEYTEAKINRLLYNFFKDKEHVADWLQTPNIWLDGDTPEFLINNNKSILVLKLIMKGL